jgi:hypothetical protein
MKIRPLVLFLVVYLITCFPTFTQAQQTPASILANAERISIGTYYDLNHKPVADTEFRVFLRFNYAGTEIRNPENAFLVTGKVRQVNLYYTDYPKGMDLSWLNQQRITALTEAMPQLAAPDVKWVIYSQTDCPDQESAINLFHGAEIIQDFDLELDLEEMTFDSTFKDFVVDQVLQRNEWTDMLVVTDLTGSMDPYIHQLFVWLRLNTTDDRVKQFVFFNDGNSELDRYKVIGATGGLYAVRADDYERVELTAIRCMMSGNGGDEPENDLEALLHGLDLCPDCHDIILIADNKSAIRDLELITRLNRPVRIILCGAEGEIANVQYLNLARETGGSVHLMEEDLLNLIELHEGEAIELFGRTYRIVDNQFVLEKKT